MFQRVTRAAVTDSYAPLTAAEKHIGAQRRSPADAQIHFLCRVHKTAAVHKRTFEFLDETITGMIRSALAVRSGASMVRFRESLAAEIASRLEVLEGSAPREQHAYRHDILSIFATGGSKVLTRRILLLLCPNGD